MTATLDKMLEKVRKWPRERQDDVADVLRVMEEQGAEPYRLDAGELTAVEEGLAQARRGEFASAEEVAALFKRFGG